MKLIINDIWIWQSSTQLSGRTEYLIELGEVLYLGGHPTPSQLTGLSPTAQEFTGCVRELKFTAQKSIWKELCAWCSFTQVLWFSFITQCNNLLWYGKPCDNIECRWKKIHTIFDQKIVLKTLRMVNILNFKLDRFQIHDLQISSWCFYQLRYAVGHHSNIRKIVKKKKNISITSLFILKESITTWRCPILFYMLNIILYILCTVLYSTYKKVIINAKYQIDNNAWVLNFNTQEYQVYMHVYICFLLHCLINYTNPS